jgi:hypothetical protein
VKSTLLLTCLSIMLVICGCRATQQGGASDGVGGKGSTGVGDKGTAEVANNGNVNAPSRACQPTSRKILNVSLKSQQTDQWCWAASGQMVTGFLQHEVSQCLQANNALGLSGIDCCASPMSDECVQPAWPEFGKYGFNVQRTSNQALTWAELTSQISCKNNPVAFSWGWTGGGGHMMVVRGYSVSRRGARYVYVNDPWEPNIGNQRLISYDDYVSGTDHNHWDDFYDFAYQSVR